MSNKTFVSNVLVIQLQNEMAQTLNYHSQWALVSLQALFNITEIFKKDTGSDFYLFGSSDCRALVESINLSYSPY